MIRFLFLLLLPVLAQAGQWRFDWNAAYLQAPATLAAAESACAASMGARNASCGSNCTLTYVSGHISGFNGAGGSDFTCNGYSPPTTTVFYAASVARWRPTDQGACPALGTVYSSGYYDIGTTTANVSSATSGTRCTSSGCTVTYTGSMSPVPGLLAGVKHFYVYGSMVSIGADVTCTPGSNAPTVSSSSFPTDSCPSGQFLSTVNGITKCYTEAGTVASSTSPTTTQTTTNATVTNGDGSKTITTTTTNNDTGASTVSTQTYASGVAFSVPPTSITTPIVSTSSGGSGTSNDPVSGLPTGSTGDYCAKNPTAAACRTTNDQQKFCDDHPDAAQCKDLGSAPTDDTIGTSSIVPTSLTPVSFTEINTCPADINLPRGIVIHYGPTCNWASMAKPLVLIMAWLTAGFVVLGLKSDG